MGGPPDLGEAAADAEQLGLGEIAEHLTADAPQGFAVWPDNMAIVDAWMIVCTQWQTQALADGRLLWLGLNYAGAKVGLDGAEMALTPAQWSGLRMMERVASAVMNGNRR